MADIGSLAPAHFRALSVLDPDEPRPMRAMAETLCCDASMATWLVDRLGARPGRTADPADRPARRNHRAHPAGIKTRDKLRESFYDPPGALLDLDIASLETLCTELRKLPAAPARKEESAES